MDKNTPSLNDKVKFQPKFRGVECTNCGHPLDLSDRFCSYCSQANNTKKLNLIDFFNEFFSSIISYDSKLLKTIGTLLTKPGQITTEFLAGKRVKYTNPFRFLLSVCIVYFLMLTVSNNFEQYDRFGAGKNGSWFREDGVISFNTELDEENNIEISQTIDSLQVRNTLKKSDSVLLSDPKTLFKELESQSLFRKFIKKREFFNAVMRQNENGKYIPIIEKYKLEDSRVNRAAFSAANSFNKFQERPGSFFKSLISRLPFAIFFFLPLFSLVIWLIYIRKKYNYTDHLVFSFHIQSLLFILLIISFIVDSIFNFFSIWFFILVFTIYLFLAMKKFYKQGYFKTLLKFLILNSVFMLLALFTITLLFISSALTY